MASAEEVREEVKAEEDAVMQDGSGAEGKAEEGGEAKESTQGEPEAPKEPEKPKELEEDAAADERPRLQAGAVGFRTADTTLNVLPVANGRLLTTLSEGGCQYLLAGTRASAGVRAGRYMFEVKIVENLNPSEGQPSNGRTPQPRQLVRVGVSAAGSSLLLADGPGSVCFDSEGFFVHEKSRKKVSQKFCHGHTVALLLNLDKQSPNANTVSLFRDGVRISEPQALPEGLRGKALYPAVTYKNVTLQAHFGPAALQRLPFECRTWASAAEADVELAAPEESADGRHEVLFPVGLPEQGFFDWVDAFVEKHPAYTELSDRKIVEWASKSGAWRPKAQAGAGSNDRLDVKFGIPMLDDQSVRRVLSAIAPTQGRNYIIPELKSNLVASERKEALLKFSAPNFKKTAVVLMGEPAAEYKEWVHALLLADKKAKREVEKKKAAQEEERKRLLEEKKKKAEEARRLKEIAQKKKEGKEVPEEPKEEEPKEEEKKDDTKAEEEAPVELSEEEKKLWYRKMDTPDLSERTLAKSYASFSVPSSEEGFDTISYGWQAEAACTQLLKSWVLEKKLTQRAEDLQPGSWFKEELSKWQKALQEWRKRQNDWKDPAKRKALLAKKKEDKKKAEGSEETAEDSKPMDINAEDINVTTVEDVTDLGNGEPLFANFVYEDWALLSARYELHLLLHAFKKDLNDADRPSFSESHLGFYYNKYFKKSFTVKHFGVETFAGFLELVKDTLTVGGENSFLQAELPEDTPHDGFVKLVEEDRRERQRRIDAGDETAKLKFSRPAPAAPPRQPPPRKPPAVGAGSGSRHSQPSAYASQKRPYSSAPPSYSASKYQRTTYASSNAGGGYYRR